MGKLPRRNVALRVMWVLSKLENVPILCATVTPVKAQLVTTSSHHMNSHKLLPQHMCSLHCCDAIGTGYR